MNLFSIQAWTFCAIAEGILDRGIEAIFSRKALKLWYILSLACIFTSVPFTSPSFSCFPYITPVPHSYFAISLFKTSLGILALSLNLQYQ